MSHVVTGLVYASWQISHRLRSHACMPACKKLVTPQHSLVGVADGSRYAFSL
jgi:hypothetical protein